MMLTPPSHVQHVALPSIRIDGGTQSRVALNEEYISELGQALSEGETLPPIILFYDGSEYWLADGFHRYHAVKRQEQETIASEVKQGARRDAVLFSVGANAQHGLRRTNADKRRAVETLLRDHEWGSWSDSEIARRCGVSPMTVGRIRQELIFHNVIDADAPRKAQRNGAIYTIQAGNIGRPPAQETQSVDSSPCSVASLPSDVKPPQETKSLFLGQWTHPSEEQEGESHDPAFSQRWNNARSERTNTFTATRKGGEEEKETGQTRSLMPGDLRFTENAGDVFLRDTIAQEKERRDAHVLRILGSSESPEWYTPEEIVFLTRELLGEIDLDPCSNSHDAPAVPARVRYTKKENGLALPWKGKTYLNPPYGSEIPLWVSKLIQSYETGEVEEAIALLPGRIDTVWFQPLYAYLICHIQGRLQFANSPYHAPFPCVIVYLGTRTDAFIDIFKCKGPILRRVG